MLWKRYAVTGGRDLAERMIAMHPRGRMRRGPFTRAYIGFLVLGAIWSYAFPAVGWVLNLLMTYCAICIQSKRLHDLGLSGWWQLAPLAPWAAWIGAGIPVRTAAGAKPADYSLLLQPFTLQNPWVAGLLACAALYLVYLIWLAAAPGDASANAYAEAPEARGLPA